ncbi:MAG: alpha/beta hydrolase [Acidobacteria bacterium]|nr:alpha/beta hydrolase [Acidobacteriota bacterium]
MRTHSTRLVRRRDLKSRPVGFAGDQASSPISGSWSDVTPADDFLCATLTLYWVTQTITSSMRDYWDNRRYPAEPTYVVTPTAFGVFAHETVPEGEPPRSYLERLYNIQRWTVFPRGGHFAPLEEPVALASDLAAFLRDLSPC